MNELVLFAGAGGGILGSVLLGHRIVCAVEIDPYCREVLLRRQEEGFLPPFPIWDDIRTFDGHDWRGSVDIVSAGFPCQPFSVAGKRKGEADERNLWPETIRVIREVGPRFAFLENVPGLLNSGYFETILGDLAASGFDARWTCLGADDCGAPHRRKRLWILAHAECGDGDTGADGVRREARAVFARGRAGAMLADSDCCGCEVREEFDSKAEADSSDGDSRRRHADGFRFHVSHAEGVFGEEIERVQPDGIDAGVCDTREPGLQGTEPEREHAGSTSEPGWWESEPRVGRVADGVANRVDRLKALGNGQVAEVARRAWETLKRGIET